MKALDRLRRHGISHCSSRGSWTVSHSPAGSLLHKDVENVGNDCRCAGLHDDCRKLGFETIVKGRKDEEEEIRNTERGNARAKDRIDIILKDLCMGTSHGEWQRR